MTPAPPPVRPNTWKAAVAGLLLFAVGDALLFRTGLYGFLAKPDSSAGWITLRCQHDEVMLPREPLTIAMFGDSRLGEGCSAELLRERWTEPTITVRSEHAPGSSPRVWAYLLEQLDPEGGRFPIVVVALPEYDDHDLREDMTDRTLDLLFLAPLVGVGATFDVAGSFDDADARREAVLTTLCKGYAWRRDVQDLAAMPFQRYLDVRRRLGQYSWGTPYPGRDGSLAGTHVEGNSVVGLPADTPPAVASGLRHLAFDPPVADTGRHRTYRARWLGRIVAHEAGTGTQVVFVRLPTQVLPNRWSRPRWQPVLDELAQQPHVHVLDRDLCAELERPEFFYDHLHLNARGRRRFTELLGDALLQHFGPRLGR